MEKVWVEAESDGRGGAVLTLVDISERRRIFESRGDHNVRVPQSGLRRMGFPQGAMQDLAQGYPVRFKMFQRGFESMLGGSEGGGLFGLEDHSPEMLATAPDEVRRVAEAMVKNAESGGFDEDRVFWGFDAANEYHPDQWFIGDNYEQETLWMHYRDGEWWYFDALRHPSDWPMKGGFREAMANAQIFFTG